jgi:sporulation protein YlmC with PRC-barrel domain
MHPKNSRAATRSRPFRTRPDHPSIALPVALLAAGIAATAAEPLSAQAQTRDLVAVEIDWTIDDLYGMEGMRGEALLDADAYDATGEEVGEVEDIVLDRDNRIVAIIAEVGGFLDIGDTTVAVPWDEIDLSTDGLILPVSDDNVEAYDVFGPDSYVTADLERTRALDDDPYTGMMTWRLSSLIDDYVLLSTGEGFGFVDDAIFDADGELRAILVEGADDYGVGPYAYPFQGYGTGWTPEDTTYTVTYIEDEPFDFDEWDGLLE